MAVKYIPDGYHTVTPYLVAKNVSGLIAFIVNAFSATVKSKHEGPGGVVMHAEVQVGNSIIMLGEANNNRTGSGALLYLYLPDVDNTYKQALASGAKSLREPTNEFYGDRNAGVEDTYGNQWWLATHIEDVTAEEIQRRQQNIKH